MTVWYKLTDEDGTRPDGTAPVVNANVRFGNPGNFTTQVAINGTVPTDAASYGRVHNASLLGQVQTDDVSSKNLYVKVMIIGDQISALSGSTGWRTQLWNSITAQSNFRPCDFVGNANYVFKDSTSGDLDVNAYSGYIATWLNIGSGSGAGLGNPMWQDVRDVTSWFLEQAPDIIIVHLGSVDALSATVAANVMTAHSVILAAARAANPSTIYLICKIIPQTNPTNNGRVSSINSAVAAWRLANWTVNSPIEVIDMNTSFNTGTMLQGDGFTPNSTGATFMAAQAFNQLDPWLFKPYKYPFPAGQPFNRIYDIVLQGTAPSPIAMDTTTAGTGTVYTWMTPGDDGVSDPMQGRTFKAGRDLINVTLTGGMTGITQNAAGGITFSGGNASSSTAGNHINFGGAIGPGYRLTCATPLWPVWYIMRVYIYTSLRQISITASMDDAKAVTRSVRINDPNLATSEAWWDDYAVAGSLYFDVQFSSDQPGKTFTVDIAAIGGSMGFWQFLGAQLILGKGTLIQTPPTIGLMFMGGTR